MHPRVREARARAKMYRVGKFLERFHKALGAAISVLTDESSSGSNGRGSPDPKRPSVRQERTSGNSSDSHPLGLTALSRPKRESTVIRNRGDATEGPGSGWRISDSEIARGSRLSSKKRNPRAACLDCGYIDSATSFFGWCARGTCPKCMSHDVHPVYDPNCACTVPYPSPKGEG